MFEASGLPHHCFLFNTARTAVSLHCMYGCAGILWEEGLGSNLQLDFAILQGMLYLRCPCYCIGMLQEEGLGR